MIKDIYKLLKNLSNKYLDVLLKKLKSMDKASYDEAIKAINASDKSSLDDIYKSIDINNIEKILLSGNVDNIYVYINNNSLKNIDNDSIDKIFKNIDKYVNDSIGNVSIKRSIVEKALNDGSKIDTLVPASIDFLDKKSGWIKWPPNDGFILELTEGNRPVKSLEVGEVIDRFGRKTGNYVSPKYPTVTYEERALPYLKNPNAYHQYEIVKPIPGVEYGEITEAFNQCGGGIQYMLPESLKYYLDNGYIKEIF